MWEKLKNVRQGKGKRGARTFVSKPAKIKPKWCQNDLQNRPGGALSRREGARRARLMPKVSQSDLQNRSWEALCD